MARIPLFCIHVGRRQTGQTQTYPDSIGTATCEPLTKYSSRRTDRFKVQSGMAACGPDCVKTAVSTGVLNDFSGQRSGRCRKHAGEQSPEDRARYEFEEHEARVRRTGLWRDPEPVPPWEWRNSNNRTMERPSIKK